MRKAGKIIWLFPAANEERNLQCSPKSEKWREREVFGTIKCPPWRSRLINGCGTQERIQLLSESWILLVLHPRPRSAFHLLLLNETIPHWIWCYRVWHFQSIWYLFDGHLLQPGGNSIARRWCPHFLAPAAAQGAVTSVKPLLLSKTQRCAFQFSKEMSNYRSEWSFIAPMWLLGLFLNFFQP